MARSDVAIKFFPTAQLLGPISRDRTGPVEHPLVGPAKGFYRCANIIEEGEGALLKAPGSVLPDIAVMVANRGLPCAIAADRKSDVEGKSGSVRVEQGGRRHL